MLKGRFGNTSGRPFFSGSLFIPRLDRGGAISFLVDTGADCSVLMPADAKRLGVDYAKLGRRRVETFGVGGRSSDYAVDAIVTLIYPGIAAYAWDIELRVMAPKRAIAQTPSLLGRDVLNRLRLVYEPAAALLEAEVRSCDARVDL